MQKTHYNTPCAEEVYLSMEGLLAQSPGGVIDDMPGDIIFDNS